MYIIILVSQTCCMLRKLCHSRRLSQLKGVPYKQMHGQAIADKEGEFSLWKLQLLTLEAKIYYTRTIKHDTCTCTVCILRKTYSIPMIAL